MNGNYKAVVFLLLLFCGPLLWVALSRPETSPGEEGGTAPVWEEESGPGVATLPGSSSGVEAPSSDRSSLEAPEAQEEEEEKWIQLEDGRWIRDPRSSWLGDQALLETIRAGLPEMLARLQQAEAEAAAADPQKSVRRLRIHLEDYLGPLGLSVEEGLTLVPEEFEGLNAYEITPAASLLAGAVRLNKEWEKETSAEALEEAASKTPEVLPSAALLRLEFGLEEPPSDPGLLHELHTLRARFLKDRIRSLGQVMLYRSAVISTAHERAPDHGYGIFSDDEISVFSPDFAALRDKDRRLTEDYLRAVRSALAARGLLPEGQ